MGRKEKNEIVHEENLAGRQFPAGVHASILSKPNSYKPLAEEGKGTEGKAET